MTWAERIAHTASRCDERYFSEHLPRVLAQRVAAASQSSWGAADQLGALIARLLPLRRPEELRELFMCVRDVIPDAVADYLREYQGANEIATMILELINATSAFECIGFSVPPLVLESFRSYLPGIVEDRDYPSWRWNKALAAIALDERLVWAPIGGHVPDENVPFHPRQAFGPNVQGLISHLGAAMLARASFGDVEPAWRAFMASADTLIDVRQIDHEIVVWVARIVFHHIGGHPLGTVADLLHDDIQRCVAEGV